MKLLYVGCIYLCFLMVAANKRNKSDTVNYTGGPLPYSISMGTFNRQVVGEISSHKSVLPVFLYGPIIVIAVIPPHILARARLNRHRGSRLTLLRENLHRSVVTFTPTGIKCCKLGEKAAKKKLSCHIHDPSRKRNMIHHKIKSTYSSSRIIIGKAEKCGVKYGKPFETCCSYREDFYRDMHRCKINFTEREDRRQCRSLVREKYT